MATINALTILSGATRESTRLTISLLAISTWSQLLPKGDSLLSVMPMTVAPAERQYFAPLVVVEEYRGKEKAMTTSLLFTLTIFSNISPAPKPETTWTLLNI